MPTSFLKVAAERISSLSKQIWTDCRNLPNIDFDRTELKVSILVQFHIEILQTDL